mgnify:FL=1
MDYYSVLGVSKTSSDQEIKKAYRKLAMKYHPDRGGDPQKFQDVSNAYDILSDPQKRQMFDMGQDPNRQQGGGFNQGPFEFHFGDMEDVMRQFGFGGGPRPKNRNINISLQLTLEDVFRGKDVAAEIPSRSGPKIVNIQVPAGISRGQQIRYQGMGDQQAPNLPPGDLIVTIDVLNHRVFKRQGNDLVLEKKINAFEAMLGSSMVVETIDKKRLNINIPKGTQPDTVLSCRGEGLPDIQTKNRGDLLVRIKVVVPKNLPDSALDGLKKIYDGL